MELTLSNVITIIGMPSIFSILAYLFKIVITWQKDNRQHDKDVQDDINLLKKAYQMQMRQTLYNLYEKYAADGWVSIDKLNLWEEQYKAYHALGANGVMDSKRDELMRLPNQKP